MIAIERRKQLEQYRDWLHSHPHRVDADVKPAALDFLNGSLAELDKPAEDPEQKENALRPGRAHDLRNRLRNLVMIILAQSHQ
ncbi:hypothetical protein D3C72_244910 [compost metagenome]